MEIFSLSKELKNKNEASMHYSLTPTRFLLTIASGSFFFYFINENDLRQNKGFKQRQLDEPINSFEMYVALPQDGRKYSSSATSR